MFPTARIPSSESHSPEASAHALAVAGQWPRKDIFGPHRDPITLWPLTLLVLLLLILPSDFSNLLEILDIFQAVLVLAEEVQIDPGKQQDQTRGKAKHLVEKRAPYKICHLAHSFKNTSVRNRQPCAWRFLVIVKNPKLEQLVYRASQLCSLVSESIMLCCRAQAAHTNITALACANHRRKSGSTTHLACRGPSITHHNTPIGQSPLP